MVEDDMISYHFLMIDKEPGFDKLQPAINRSLLPVIATLHDEDSCIT